MATDVDRLRKELGESIPSGGSAADTLFTVDEINDLLTTHDTLDEAIARGWSQKAAMLSNLVNTEEGMASRAMSDLHKAAIKQAQFWSSKVSSGRGHARTHPLTRS